ncbi:DUF2073 domain-containing protein [Candidatus Woesearchaeota archaeon]|nr:DUF2073 domain-containing protein [Candidatus Woesearchaeota archaeon]
MSLTLQFIPYQEIAELGSARRVKKLIDIVKENKIVLLEGRLKKEEEKDLIQITMEEIDEQFKGIELAIINPESRNDSFLTKMKLGLVNVLMKERTGLTIIGPATIVKEIKQNPDKIELLMNNQNKKVKKRVTRRRKR